MGFVDEIFSGKYPQLEKLWVKEFSRVVDEVFGCPEGTVLPGEEVGGLEDEFPFEDQISVAVDVDRLEGLLAEERSRHESVRRQVEVLKAERDALLYRLEAARRELMT